MGTVGLVASCLSHVSLLVRCSMCAGDGILWEVPLEKNVELKCVQVNVLKSLTRLTKRVGDKQIDEIAGSA